MTDQLFPDKKFLEFWGNLLINAAKGQEQFEQLASLINLPASMPPDTMKLQGMDRLLKQFYNMGRPSAEGKDASKHPPGDSTQGQRPDMKEAYGNLTESFSTYAKLWGWIPQKDHEALQKELDTLTQTLDSLQRSHDALTKKSQTQEELISRLRKLLSDDGKGDVVFFQELQDLAKKQSEDFQTFMSGLGTIFTQKEDLDTK